MIVNVFQAYNQRPKNQSVWPKETIGPTHNSNNNRTAKQNKSRITKIYTEHKTNLTIVYAGDCLERVSSLGVNALCATEQFVKLVNEREKEKRE